MPISFPAIPFVLKNSILVLASCFIVAYLFIGFYALLSDYIILDSNIYLGLALLPYVCIIRERKGNNFTYFGLAVIFIILSFFIYLRSLYYLTLCFAMLFVLESYLGKLNHLPLFLLLVLSPLFKYLVNIFGFPIRLQLSQIAGNIIQQLGYQVEVQGNIISLNGFEFAVDSACVGLQMMITSFIIGIFMLAYYERKMSKSLAFIHTSLILLSIIALNIVCNLIRIVILLLFKLLPESPFHYMAGIICLIIYVIIPLNFICKWVYAHTNEKIELTSEKAKKYFYFIGCNCFLLLGITALGIQVRHNKSTLQENPTSCSITGYNSTMLDSGIIKLEKNDALVYVKPIAKQYGVEHSPMVCWQGSGYEFKNISKLTIDTIEIYTGTLVKNKDVIYTAWWFDNGTHKTIDQLDWRWKVFQGAPEFSLINVNASSEAMLLKEVKAILPANIFQKDKMVIQIQNTKL